MDCFRGLDRNGALGQQQPVASGGFLATKKRDVSSLQTPNLQI